MGCWTTGGHAHIEIIHFGNSENITEISKMFFGQREETEVRRGNLHECAAGDTMKGTLVLFVLWAI